MPDENDIVFNEYSLDIFSLIDRLWLFLSGGSTNSSGATGGEQAVDAVLILSDALSWLSTFWGFVTILSWIISFLLIWGLIYAYILGSKLGEVVDTILAEQEEAYGNRFDRSVKNRRWEDVKKHIESKRPADWHVAIIEADIILADLLEHLGLAGNSVGEKLKSASSTSFGTLDQAWRAHKVRNHLAHEGASYKITKREAEEVITQYKMVFEEFDYI